MKYSVCRYSDGDSGYGSPTIIKEEGVHEQYYPHFTLLDREQVDVCVEALNKLEEIRRPSFPA